MFKSQKIIVFSILLALVGIGAVVAIGVGISVRDSVNPDKSSAAIPLPSSLTYSGKIECKSLAGNTYTKSTMAFSVFSYANYDAKSDELVFENNETVSTLDKLGNYSISVPNNSNFDFIKIRVKASGVNTTPTNCINPNNLVSSNGNIACLNKEQVKTENNLCGINNSYVCERNKNDTTFSGFDFKLTACPEPVLDLATTAINTNTTISKNIGESLTMYFNGEDLSDYNTLNTNYYIGQQGFSNIFSSYKVYLCENKADTTCKTEVITSNLSIPQVDVSPWSIIAKGKNIKIKVEGKLLSTAKANQPIKIQYAQLPGSIVAMTDSNGTNNVWNGSVSILAPVVTVTPPVVTPPVVTPPVVNPPVVTSSTGTRTTTSRRSTSSNGSVVSESSSTESIVSTESSSSEESTISSEESTSTRSTSSIKPYVPVTTTPSNDNTTLLLALVALLVLFLVSLFVVYRKYKSEKESKEVFTPSPLSETPPTPTPTV